MLRGMRHAAALLALPLISLTGCGWLFGDDDGGGDSPCSDDIFACDDDTSKFMEDPSCTLTGDLDLVVGQGETEFSPLAAGELPDVEFGFQGGQHFWGAIQVRNPDLERRQLLIRIKADFCNSDCEQASSWTSDNIREMVADESTMTVTADGYFEQTRMLVTVYDWAYAEQRRVEEIGRASCRER